MTPYPRNILVASSDPEILPALRSVLPLDALVLSGVAESAEDLSSLANEVTPDAIVVDSALSRDGILATLSLAAALTPAPRVVLLQPASSAGGPREPLDPLLRSAVHVECDVYGLNDVLADLVRGWRLAHEPIKPAPLPIDELRRLQALHRYEILDSDPEPAFDNLTRLAQQICGTSVALISLVDADRQWFKSRVGLDIESTERNVSFCQYAILKRGVTLVQDATEDVRFASNPLVTGTPGIRFYAGAPLRTGNGHAVGTLCVIHDEPHGLTDWQISALETLAQQAVAALELRLQLRRAQRERHEQAYLRRAVSEASHFYELLVDSIDGIVWECDAEHWNCSYVSAGVERLLDYSPAHWLTERQQWRAQIHPEDHDAAMDAFQDVAANGGERSLELRMRRRDGETVWLRGRVQAIDFRDRPRRLRALTVDISDAKRAQAALLNLVTVDDLTGLPNRRGMRDHLRATLASAGRHGEKVAVMFLDLDRFKSVNDTLGHSAGDALIVEIGRRLRTCMRATDLVARLGGDEFLVVAAGIHNPEEAAQLARKIIERVSETVLLDDQPIHPSCSVGISLFPDDGIDMEALLRTADLAMYAAKQRGPGASAVFAGPMQERISRRVATENELHRAIEQDEFEMHYQPLFGVRTGDVVGAEALIRWRHPARGLIMPAEFIAVSEETGQIHAIGAKVIAMVCRQVGEWTRDGYVVPRVAVNVSGVQFRNGLLAQVSRELHNNRIAGAALDFEITETTLAQDPEVALQTLTPLRNLGVRVTIDDFGVGYSSLLSLRQYPVQAIKIDRQFVAELPGNAQCEAIVSAIISMARSMSLAVIAEGVETPEALDALHRMGCDHFQGFVMAPPVEAREFSRRFLQRR